MAIYRVGRIRKDNEANIIAAAEKEFASHGYSGASIVRIAKSAGVPRANVHYYFKSKDELYSTLLMDIVEMWNNSFPDITPDDEPATAIGTYIESKLEFSRTNPLSSKIFASEILRGAPTLKEYLETTNRAWLLGKVDVIQAWIDQGKMDEIDPFYLIFMIWSSTQHYADFDTQVKTALDKPYYTISDYEDIARTVTHIILKGCGIKPVADGP
jgi:TetR/AcrR family transcriptional regulator